MTIGDRVLLLAAIVFATQSNRRTGPLTWAASLASRNRMPDKAPKARATALPETSRQKQYGACSTAARALETLNVSIGCAVTVRFRDQTASRHFVEVDC